MNTEIFDDMSNEDYHAHPAIGSSGIKLMERSPAHYYAKYLAPDRERKEPTAAMKTGTAWHCAVFEPERFKTAYTTGHDANPLTKRAKLLDSVLDGAIKIESLIALPEGLGATTKEGKALVAELESIGNVPCTPEDFDFVANWHPKMSGRTVLSSELMANIERMAEAARNHPIMAALFKRKHVTEQSIFADFVLEGVRGKIRPDFAVLPCDEFPNGVIVDGKSTEDASASEFSRSAWNYDMAVQAAFYQDVFQFAYKTKGVPDFLWLAQEKEAPFATAVYSADANLLRYGRKKYLAALIQYQDCMTAGKWPAYPRSIQMLQLPAWAEKTVHDELGIKQESVR